MTLYRDLSLCVKRWFCVFTIILAVSEYRSLYIIERAWTIWWVSGS
jgi:hypothetical protein